MFRNGRVKHPSWIQLTSLFLAEGKTPREQAGNEDSRSKSLVEHHQRRNPAYSDVCVYHTSGLQRITNRVLKMTTRWERTFCIGVFEICDLDLLQISRSGSVFGFKDKVGVTWMFKVIFEEILPLCHLQEHQHLLLLTHGPSVGTNSQKVPPQCLEMSLKRLRGDAGWIPLKMRLVICYTVRYHGDGERPSQRTECVMDACTFLDDTDRPRIDCTHVCVFCKDMLLTLHWYSASRLGVCVWGEGAACVSVWGCVAAGTALMSPSISVSAEDSVRLAPGGRRRRRERGWRDGGCHP